MSKNSKLLSMDKHQRDKQISSLLSEDLRKQYNKRNIRVIKGDTVKILRGEYAGIEGKVERVNTERSTLQIEGVQRPRVRGGNVKVQIHSSKVLIKSLLLDDKYREAKLGGKKIKKDNSSIDNTESKKSRASKQTKKKDDTVKPKIKNTVKPSQTKGDTNTE